MEPQGLRNVGGEEADTDQDQVGRGDEHLSSGLCTGPGFLFAPVRGPCVGYGWVSPTEWTRNKETMNTNMYFQMTLCRL